MLRKTLQFIFVCLLIGYLLHVTVKDSSEQKNRNVHTHKLPPRIESPKPQTAPRTKPMPQDDAAEPLERKLAPAPRPKTVLRDGELKIQGEADERKLPEDGIFSEFVSQGFCYKVTYFYTYPLSDPSNPPVPAGFKQAYTAGQSNQSSGVRKGRNGHLRNRIRYFYKDCPTDIEEPRYDLCVAVLFLWERDDDVARFVEYYSNEGVQKFFLYYNGNLSTRKTLPVYDSVEYHDWNYPFYIDDQVVKSSSLAKMTFLTKVSRHYLPRCEHLIHADLDEYFYHKSKSLSRYVREDISEYNAVTSRTSMATLLGPPGILNFNRKPVDFSNRPKSLYSSRFRGIMSAHVPIVSTKISGIEFNHTVDNIKFDKDIIVFHFTFAHKHMSLSQGQIAVHSNCVADLFNKSALTCPEIFL